jgi:hypothetical protein
MTKQHISAALPTDIDNYVSSPTGCVVGGTGGIDVD